MGVEVKDGDLWRPTIFLNGELAYEASADILWWLGYWRDYDPNRRLSVFIDSNGCDLFATTAIAEAFKISPNPITTVVIGRGYSGAALIAASGDRGHRWAFKNADFMIHQLQPGNMEATPIDTQEQDMAWEKRWNNIFLKLLSNATGQPLGRIRKDTEFDKYMNAREALEYGLIDHIVKWKKSPEKKPQDQTS